MSFIKSSFRIALAAFVAILLFSAGSVVYRNWGRSVGDLVVQPKPEEGMLAGRWQLQSISLPSVTNRTGKIAIHAELILKPNGNFTAVEFPIEDSFSNPKWSIKTGDGFWELYRNQYWVVSLGFAGGFGMPLDIRNKDGIITALTYSVGDPDSNELWIWRRVIE